MSDHKARFTVRIEIFNHLDGYDMVSILMDEGDIVDTFGGTGNNQLEALPLKNAIRAALEIKEEPQEYFETLREDSELRSEFISGAFGYEWELIDQETGMPISYKEYTDADIRNTSSET